MDYCLWCSNGSSNRKTHHPVRVVCSPACQQFKSMSSQNRGTCVEATATWLARLPVFPPHQVNSSECPICTATTAQAIRQHPSHIITERGISHPRLADIGGRKISLGRGPLRPTAHLVGVSDTCTKQQIWVMFHVLVFHPIIETYWNFRHPLLNQW